MPGFRFTQLIPKPLDFVLHNACGMPRERSTLMNQASVRACAPMNSIEVLAASIIANFFNLLNSSATEEVIGLPPCFSFSHKAIQERGRAATAPAANSGGLTLWIDGVEKGALSGTDNDTLRLGRIHLSAVARLDAGAAGSYYFDALFDGSLRIGARPMTLSLCGKLVAAASSTGQRLDYRTRTFPDYSLHFS